jgi:hypothetical protein
MGSEDGSDVGLIEVWKTVNNKPINEFTYRTDDEPWDPSEAVWRDALTIEFVRNSRSDSSEPHVKTAGRLNLTGAKWILASSSR